MNPKNILLTKTFWANIIALLAAVLATRDVDLDADTQVQIVAGVMAIMNVILRLFTHRPSNIPGLPSVAKTDPPTVVLVTPLSTPIDVEGRLE